MAHPIDIIDPLARPDWDRELAPLPGATFFQSRAWLGVLHATYGFPARAFCRFDSNGTLQACLVAMEVDSWLTGRRGVSLPFTDAAGIAGQPGPVFDELRAAALAHGREHRWKYLELRDRRGLPASLSTSLTFLGHTLDLKPGGKALLAGCEGSVRRAIRKAEQAGVAIEFSTSADAMARFHHLFCLTRKRHGLPPPPHRFFSNIQQSVLARGLGTIVLASHAGTPVAGAVYLRWGNAMIYKYGASDERHQHLRGNNLVMWRAISRFAEEGCSSLDFGRTSMANEGLRRFKLGWGATEHLVEYVRVDCRSGAVIPMSDDASGWHTRLFHHLPTPGAKALGALLYRHVA